MFKRASAIFVAAALVAACGSGDDTATTDDTATGGTDAVQDDGSSTAAGGQVVQSVPAADEFDPEATFRWGYTVEATSMDPHRGSSGFDQNWLLPAYDRLVYVDPDGDLKPMLATDWELVDDDAALEMHLREGVVFHDGAEMDATAVKASLDRAMLDEQSTVAPVFESVESIDVVDDFTIRFTLSGPPGALIANLGDRAGMIISPNALENPDLDRHPVGAGAYEVTEYQLGDRVIYERFDEYWDPDIQRTAGLDFRIMSADETRFNAVRAGEIDVALARENQVEPGLNVGLNLLEGPTPNFYSFAINSSVEPFDDPKVRRALDYAIDREAIAEGIFGGHCQPTRQPFPETSWAFNEEIGHGLDVYDPEKARELLADAGLENGFEFNAATSDITGYTTLGEVLQSMFGDVGVTMNIDITDQVSQLFSVDQSHPASVGAYAPTPDPSGVPDSAYLPGALNNPGGYEIPGLVDLAREGLESLEIEERAPVYREMAEVMMEGDAPYLPICMRTRQELFVSTTTGISIYVSGARDWRGVAIANG